MKKIISFIMGACLTFALNSCTCAAPEADEEGALIKHPVFFGHGGVDESPISTGLTWCAPTTDVVYFKIIPIRYKESFDDIFSNDNTPLDFDSYITIQIEKGKTPILLQNYGEKWYENNIQSYYRNKTREYVSMFSPFDLISNREVLNKIDNMIMKDMKAYISKLSKSKEFPIMVCNVMTGSAKPNKDQLDEMNKTAQYIQQKRSMEQKANAETARAEAERKRAEADKAYMTSMNLNPQQFISLKWIETIANKQGANIDVLVGGGETPMWNIKR